jgi:hypothetical protein
MDKLEDYIRKHRLEMDIYKPSARVRNRIIREAAIKRGRNLKWIYLIATAAVVTGFAMIFLRPGNPDPERIYRAVSRSDNQLRETEIYYNDLANSIYREATPLLVNNPEIEKELSSDMSHIDSICKEIKKDLKDNVANQEVIEALIRNYRSKIKILEEMLEVLKENEGNKQKKVTNEL